MDIESGRQFVCCNRHGYFAFRLRAYISGASTPSTAQVLEDHSSAFGGIKVDGKLMGTLFISGIYR
jgi:hypothetical protein